MIMVNALYKLGNSPGDLTLLREGMGLVLRLLGPIAPHISHRLWVDLGYGSDILQAAWPQPDAEALRQDSIQYVVQVNGKLRARIEVVADAGREQVEEIALADPNVQNFTGGKPPRKVIVVPGKLVNIVSG